MSLFHAIYGEGGVSPEPGGDTYGETQVLLWTNSNLSAKFAAQTVSLDLTDYDGVIVEFKQSAGASPLTSGVSKIPKGNYTRYGTGYTVAGSESRARNVIKVDNNGVQFDGSTYGTAKPENGYCIPYRIYGYRQYKKETLTSAITDQKVLAANTDLNIGKGNYILTTSLSATTEAPSFSKGSIVSYVYSIEGEQHSKGMLVKANDDGIVAATFQLLYQIITVG